MSASRVLTVIPARLASQRLPEKPLRDIEGQTLLERVWRRGTSARRTGRVVIATDDARIEKLARSFGAEVVMTAESITTGSQRVAATCELLGKEHFDLVVNLQGDMPFIRPELIDRCIEFLERERSRFEMATIATPITEESTYLSSSDVKVVVGGGDRALYFSRAPVPHSRDGNRMSFEGREVFGFKHFGLYAFLPSTLEEFRSNELSALESVEKLEQLRLLERGYRIGVQVVPVALTADSVEVDTPADLERSREIARKG